MSEQSKHGEPWREHLGTEIVDFGDHEGPMSFNAIRDVNGTEVARAHELLRLRRIVACVNACAGLPTEALEAGALGKALDALVAVYEGRSVTFADALRALGRVP